MSEHDTKIPAPARVLVIQLVPTPTLLGLLRLLRARWESARLLVLTASPEGEEELAAAADEVLGTAGVERREVARRVRQCAPEVVIVAGGADYGLRPAYLKAAALARLSGAPHRWQWEPGEALGRPLGNGLSSALARPVRRGWARTGGAARARIVRRWHRRYYQRPPTRGPRVVQIGITEACNYRCVMCPFHNPVVDEQHRESEQPRMSLDMFARLVTDLKRLGAEDVDLYGDGEPLTHPQAMEMIELARQAGLRVALATNGALVSDERARRLVDLGISRLHVSVNAATEETYAAMHPGTPPGRLPGIVARLRRMAEYADASGQPRVPVEISAVLTRLNRNEIPLLVRVAQAARADWVLLIVMGAVKSQPDLPPREEDWVTIREGIREARRLGEALGIVVGPAELEATASTAVTRSIYERIPCYMGHEFSQILANGEVRFCCYCLLPMGNLHARSFAEIWSGAPYQAVRREAMMLPVSRRPPYGCGCFGGCCHVPANVAVHRRLHGDGALRGIG